MTAAMDEARRELSRLYLEGFGLFMIAELYEIPGDLPGQ